MLELEETRVAIIGLGYVGVQLATAFGRQYHTIGFDIDERRVAELRDGTDSTEEVSPDTLIRARGLFVTTDVSDLADCDVYIISVPTPVDRARQPDLNALKMASQTVGSVLSPGNIAIYESTVFPGATEDICVPELEQASGLTFNDDFAVGYSPERINPGDPDHRIESIVKVTSASNEEAAEFVDRLYASVVPAGTCRVSSIQVAEAAKVIENTQRDVNIALINELAMIFDRLGIDTREVLSAAETKWNFLGFKPGLVGGHCIGVDPYYLTHKSQEIGYHPEMILAGRRINDNMGLYVSGRIIRLMIERRIQVSGSRILVLGLAFKEDCSDLRNTRVIDVVRELEAHGANVDVYDPMADKEEAQREHKLSMPDELEDDTYDAIVLAVAHQQFREMDVDSVRRLGRENHVLYDVKSVFPADAVDGRL